MNNWRVASLGGGLLAVAVVAACSSGAASPPTTSRSTSPSAAPTVQGGPGAGRGPGAPAAEGTIAAVAAGSIEVQNPSSGQVTVTYTAQTSFTQTVSATLAAVRVGRCVFASAAAPGDGSSSARPSPSGATALTATTVFVGRPVHGTCQPGGGIGGVRPGGTGGVRPGGTGAPSTLPLPSGSRRPGGIVVGEAADGTVRSVSGSTITVSGTDPRNKAAVTYTVTVDASTKYSQTAPATAKALAVGKCAVATGSSDHTGAVAATSIRLSRPTDGGCTGGRRFEPRPGGSNG